MSQNEKIKIFFIYSILKIGFCFLNIIKKDNKNTKSIYGLAYIEQKANNFLSAEKYYRRAVELEPKYEEALYGLAYSLLTLKKHSEAIEVFQEMETSIDKKVADRVRRTLCEYHNEEITKNLPQTD